MKEENYSLNINNLIVLCHIIDDFEEFEKRLLPVISPKYNRDFVFQLWDVSRGKFKLFSKKAKKFYNENKIVIDIINRYSNIPFFINLNYGYHGEQNDDLEYFYQYIFSHKNDIDKILILLEKLKELGFDKIKFNKNLDFTNDIYKIDTKFSYNYEFVYLDNIEAIPSYNECMVSYKSNASNYKIVLGLSFGKIKKYDMKIFLNDLTFDINELPNDMSKEETFDKIIELKENKKYEYSVVRDSVNLGVGIHDLYAMYSLVSLRINGLENVEKKAELIELLEIIKEAIIKMQEIGCEYNNNIASNEQISSNFLEEQKNEYVRRRKLNSIDYC